MKLLQSVRLVFLLLIMISANPSFAEVNDESMAGIQFTKAEINWLKRHKTIRIAYDGDLHPYSFVGRKGALRGSAVEIMKLLSQRLGIKFVTYPSTDWKTLFKAAVMGNVDVIATMVKRPERLLWFNFTEPYLTQSLVIVSRGDDDRFSDRESIKGKKIALIANYQYSYQVREDYPKIKPVFVSSLKNGLKAVQTGKADAAVLFSGARYFLLSDASFSNLKIASVYDHESMRQSIAIRKDWPELVTIFQKGLESLSENEKQNFIDKWDPPEEEDEVVASITPVKVVVLEPAHRDDPEKLTFGDAFYTGLTVFASLALIAAGGGYLRLKSRRMKKNRYSSASNSVSQPEQKER
ncbi:transporter substrate-binding domain-containing protein [Methylicorpusculum sp.]|uniref:transporter substrate-binding domain-containing protein n=1 Tax=Methylicorpusculum sp. TaxID=2713644 RepID=UPI002726FD49|nr:transporter substrate-binding domain-containing protein [Methylicorpusculum sp.]MDO8844683.1 transporter substrate-binding domain-containing protein [Methylicorpusculum sp.]